MDLARLSFLAAAGREAALVLTGGVGSLLPASTSGPGPHPPLAGPLSKQWSAEATPTETHKPTYMKAHRK